jgi:hypothetical protein
LLSTGTPEAERGLKEYGVLAHTPVLGEDPARLRCRVQLSRGSGPTSGEEERDHG